nr:four helix bundle protein [Chryseobacterium sp. Y16C]
MRNFDWSKCKGSSKCREQGRFIHKLKIAAKEADETECWLLLCLKSPHLKSPNDKLISELKEILLILSKIIASSKLK